LFTLTKFKAGPLLLACVAALGLSACTVGNVKQPVPAQSDSPSRQFNVLAINDVYNVEGTDGGQSGGMARLRTLRQQLGAKDQPVLLLHGGDFLFPSSMSSQYKGQQMVDLMNRVDGDENAFDDRFYVTFGNHEFDKKAMKYASMINQRIAESDFYWLGSNVHLKPEASEASEGFNRSLLKNAITTINGVKVGLYSITTNIAIPDYAQIDSDYVAVSKRNIAQLKALGAEVIIAVTHLTMSQDKALLTALGELGPDVVFGGHEHNRQVACVGKRCIIKADADIRSATIATITLSGQGEVKVSHRFSLIKDSTIVADPELVARTDYWINRYQQEYCQKNNQFDNCLLEPFGKTSVDLIAEELEIRRFETNLGAYVAEQAIAAFDSVALPGNKKVQVALVNSGSLRLNQNIPAGSAINNWIINGIFQYPADLRVIEISGKTLKAVVNHQIQSWTGNGWWLQSAGIAFIHDVQNQRVTDLTLIDVKGNKTPVKDDDKIVVVANNYITNPDSVGDQDGYTMLNLANELVYADQLIDLKDHIISHIKSLYKDNKAIAPQLPGRICSTARPDLPCVLK
jgi:2',3'-cyclic-nucleotide 2'-phosphodiesterase (5'-nucleotidase family)